MGKIVLMAARERNLEVAEARIKILRKKMADPSTAAALARGAGSLAGAYEDANMARHDILVISTALAQQENGIFEREP